MGTIIQMIGTTAGGTENALASIDVPSNGELVGVCWTYEATLDTTLDSMILQLSFGSTVSLVNDSRQVLSNYDTGRIAILSSVGATPMGGFQYHPLPNVTVSMGERLYIHGSGASGVVGTFRALLSFTFDLDKVQVRRR